jgi:hypothetical protein
MRVLSILFLGLFLTGFVLTDAVYAQEVVYMGTVTNVKDTCYVVVEHFGVGLRISKQCVSNQSNEVVNTTEFWDGIDEIVYVYELIRTSSGELKVRVRIYDLDFNEDGPEVDELLDEFDLPGFSPATPYGFQANGAGLSGQLKTSASSAAPPNRLLTVGPRNAVAGNDYLSYVLNGDGSLTGAKNIIFSNPNNKGALGSSVSRDGSMAVELSATSALWTLVTRKLKNGVPAGAPISWTVPSYNGYSPDITNAIEENSGIAGVSAQKIRYLVYRVFRNVGTASQQSQIVIQKIDDAKGKPIGAPIPLTQFKNAFQAGAESVQSLALSPDGKLLLFTEYSGACKKMILKAASLSGNKFAKAPVVVAGCAGLASTPFGFLGLDIMRLSEEE